jgi:alkanesulfonate monooxygenase SsuD/methylene tetrahydromethanopterin reductase-like flavin-dependent oxidoreductase (luciferase family)
VNTARELQQRIDAALRDPHTNLPRIRFSPYLSVVAGDLQDKLTAAAQRDGVEGILDEFERLEASQDPELLRRALVNVLYYDSAARSLGLQVPFVGKL